jgi:probable HAF family extracellular repeat protein
MHAARTNKDNLLNVWLVAVALAIAVAVAVAVLSEQQSAQAQETSTEGSYTVTDLGTLGGSTPINGSVPTVAWDINEVGQVVGYSTTSSGEEHAFLYSGGQMVDLNSLIPSDSGWTLVDARAINDGGQIVGWGDYGGYGILRAFLLTPQKTNYSFSGFFRPVDNPPTLNTVKAGSAVPVKFSLGGYEGLDIFSEGYPKSRRIDCSSSAPLDTVEQTTRAAGGSSLSYDATTERYTYAWKNKKAWSGTCRQLVVQLDDGSVHRGNFKFR